MVVETPAYITVLNNWCHFNKANRENSSRGTVPYHIEEQVWRYAEDGAIDAEQDKLYSTNDHVSVYTGKREAVDVEKLITETAAGVIEITWEQFEEIGIDPAEWNLDVEIPTKTIAFPRG